jgi:hypothetical protein
MAKLTSAAVRMVGGDMKQGDMILWQWLEGIVCSCGLADGEVSWYLVRSTYSILYNTPYGVQVHTNPQTTHKLLVEQGIGCRCSGKLSRKPPVYSAATRLRRLWPSLSPSLSFSLLLPTCPPAPTSNSQIILFFFLSFFLPFCPFCPFTPLRLLSIAGLLECLVDTGLSAYGSPVKVQILHCLEAWQPNILVRTPV